LVNLLDKATFENRIHDLESFGHRGSATHNESRAAEYLVAQLRASGLDPQLEGFRGIRSLPARCVLHIFVSGIGACLC